MKSTFQFPHLRLGEEATGSTQWSLVLGLGVQLVVWVILTVHTYFPHFPMQFFKRIQFRKGKSLEFTQLASRAGM